MLSSQLSETYINIIKTNENKKKNLDMNSFEFNKEYIKRFRFIMSTSCYLPHDLIEYGQINLDRKKAIEQLEEVIHCYPLSREIELGIFEFSLNYVKIQLLNYDNLFMIYQDKLFELIDNLDINNKRISNKTLLPALISGALSGQVIAFLKMFQLHPQRWKYLIDKNNLRDDTLYTINTTDSYKCGRCGLSKHTYYITQTRSADEPATIFYTCINCKKTFTKSI